MHVNLPQPAYSVAYSNGEQSIAASDSSLPSAYPPPVYQSSPAGYGLNVSSPPFDAYADYQGAPPAFGHAQPTAPPPQLLSYQNVHVNATGFAVAQPSVIIAQPAPVVRSPPTYLGWSIFNFLCCFWPLGLAAIIYSVKVGGAHNHEEAKRHSATARNLNIAATTIAPILVIVVVVVATAGNTAMLSAAMLTAATAAPSRHSPATLSPASSSRYLPSTSVSAYYYSYGYSYYYTYLTYYTYFDFGSYLAYGSYYSSFSNSVYYYSYTDYRAGYVTASQYVLGSSYQYSQGVSYSRYRF